MPAEWETHEAVWLAWPYDRDSFPNLEGAENAFSRFVAEVSEDERVELLVTDELMEGKAKRLLEQNAANLEAVNFHILKYADIWFRDYGPIFVVNREHKKLAMTKWIFNAWGNKYKELLPDNEIPYAMNKLLKLPQFETGMVLEGGSIEVNGKGTLLTTRQCLLNPNRNPALSKSNIENTLRDYLGATNIIWLKSGIEGDDTDGHIDDIARFVSPSTVLCAYQDDKSDPDYQALRENLEILNSATDQDGRKLEVIRLPVPGRVGPPEKRLPASYANFYIGNSKVLVPTFSVKNDERAIEVIRSAFPGRKVVGINAYFLAFGCGTFHCMSQQQPAV